ncbi:MAG: gluconokinase [Ferruginibacter sp.]|nr:gluconokinase [Ferruginibacter sp.]
MRHPVIFIMGVSGTGKTTIGQILSTTTGYAFFDADDFHPAENKAKMNSGIPLQDDDRWPWLKNIHEFVVSKSALQPVILVCSALKQSYRERLANAIEESCTWIYLKGDFDLVQQRLNERKGHYMPSSLLQSQFDALEAPEDAVTIDIAQSPAAIVAEILVHLNWPQ